MHPAVDWKLAPKDAEWWAVDADGKAVWFTRPNIQAHTSFWYHDQFPAPTFGFDGDWRESLTPRSK